MADNWQLKAVLSANSDSMVKALGDVSKMAKTARKYLGDVGSAAGKVGTGLGLPVAALSGILGGFSLMAVKNAVVGFTEMGEAVKNGALKTGMSVQEFQKMKYVAEQSGTSIDDLGASVSKLNKNIGAAASGRNNQLASLMKRLGISMRDANGDIVRGIDILPKLADAMKRNKSSGMKDLMGATMFGKSYAAILPMLLEGSAGIQANLDRMAKLKGVLDDSDIDAAKDLGDSFKDLSMVTKGFQVTIAKELTPVIRPLVDDLTAWWVANKKLVGVEVSKMAKDLGEWVAKIDFKQILKDTSGFVKSLGRLVDMVGGAKNALIGLVLYMNIQTIMAIGGLIGSIGRLGWAFAAFAIKSIPKVLLALGLYEAETIVAAGTTDALTVSTKAADAAALGWVKNLKAVFGVLGQIAIAAAPLAVMWGVKEWAEDTEHDQERVSGIQNNMAAPAKSMLSMFGFDKDAEIERRRAANRAELDGGAEFPGAAPRSSLLAPAARVNASGVIEVTFKDAPPGMRVEQTKAGGDVPINSSVGYRSYATGMP